MEIFNNLLFWLHLAALALGGAASFGIPIVGSRIRAATAESRPLLFSMIEALSRLGRAALIVLIITGPLLVWLRFGGVAGFNFWFWVKMVLVVLMLIVIILAGINGKRAEHGDAEAMRRAPMLGATSAGLFMLIILSAVFAFN